MLAHIIANKYNNRIIQKSIFIKLDMVKYSFSGVVLPALFKHNSWFYIK